MEDRPLNDRLWVRIISKNEILFEGEARSVSSFNKVGPFDILPQHENFISLLRDKAIIVDTSGKGHEVKFVHGLLEVSDNKVRVFVGI